jgi:hypothetical protein
MKEYSKPFWQRSLKYRRENILDIDRSKNKS